MAVSRVSDAEMAYYQQRRLGQLESDSPDPLEPFRVADEQRRFTEMESGAPDVLEPYRVQAEQEKFLAFEAEADDPIAKYAQAAQPAGGSMAAYADELGTNEPPPNAMAAPVDPMAPYSSAPAPAVSSPPANAYAGATAPAGEDADGDDPVVRTLRFLKELDAGPLPTDKLTTSQAPPAPVPPPEPNLISDLARTAGEAILPPSFRDAERNARDQAPTPDLPPIGFAGVPALPWQPPKPTQPPEDTTDRILAGEALGAQDFVDSFTKAASNQGSSPAFADGMPGIRLGRSERDSARAFAQGLTEGAGAGPGLGAGVRAVGDISGGGDVLASMRALPQPSAEEIVEAWRGVRDDFELIREGRDPDAGVTLRHGPTGLELEGFGSIEDAQRFGARLASADLSTREGAAAAIARIADELMEEGENVGRPNRANGPPTDWPRSNTIDSEQGRGPVPAPAEVPGAARAVADDLDQAAGRVDPAVQPAGVEGAIEAEAARPVAPSPPSTVPALQYLERKLTESKVPEGPSVPERLEQVRRRFVRAWTDRGVDLGQYQREAENAAGRPLRPDEMAYELNRLTGDKAAQVKVQEGLAPAARLVGGDDVKLSVALLLEDNAAMGRAWANKGLNDLADELGPERWRRVRDSADKVRAFVEQVDQRRADAGLPLPPRKDGRIFRDSDAGEDTTADPLAWAQRYAYETESAARTNETFAALANLSRLHPGGGVRLVEAAHTLPKDSPNAIVSGYVNGRAARLEMPKEMAAALEQERIGTLPGLPTIMSIFRAAVTSRNPTFLVGNAGLDALNFIGRTATREGGSPLKYPGLVKDLGAAYIDAFSGLLKGEITGEASKRYLKGGGGQFGFFQNVPEPSARDLARTGAIQVSSVGDALGLVKDLLLVKPVEVIGERVELAPRIAAMKRAERAGANAVEAVIAGRTVTVDFAQGGNIARQINGFVPFFNVAMQGASVPARAFGENKVGFVATLATMLVAPVVAAEAWNRSDPQRAKDYEDIPDSIRDAGVVIVLPGEPPRDNRGERRPQFVYIRTREFTPGVLLVREIAGRQLGADPKQWQDLLLASGSSISPVQGESGADLLSSIFPPGVSTAAQIAYNQDTYRGRPIATDSNDQYASDPAKAAAAGLTQGTRAIGIDQEPRPSQVDFVARDFGGGVANAAFAGYDLAQGQNPRTDRPQDIPVVGGFVKRFVRDDIGGRLERVKAEGLSDTNRQALADSGVHIEPVVAGGYIGDTPLTNEQREQYQRLVNAKLDAAVGGLLATEDWHKASRAQRGFKIKVVSDGARRAAEAEMAAQYGIALKGTRGAGSPTPRPERTPGREPTATRFVLGGPTETSGRFVMGATRTPTRTPDPDRSEAARRGAQTRRENAGTAAAEARR
jgi:hypothetical protein